MYDNYIARLENIIELTMEKVTENGDIHLKAQILEIWKHEKLDDTEEYQKLKNSVEKEEKELIK